MQKEVLYNSKESVGVVRPLTRQHIPVAADILATVYEKDPLFQSFLRKCNKDVLYKRYFVPLIRGWMKSGHLVQGLFVDGNIRGVALLTAPGKCIESHISGTIHS